MSKLSKTAETILDRRYYIKDESGNPIEDWEGLCWRVSRAIAKPESPDLQTIVAEQFFDAIHNLDFLPNSPCLMNAGTDIGQLSACFVLPIEDNMAGIFDAIKYAALVHQCLSEKTPIRTTTGLKKISQLKIGDLVYDRDGIIRKVLDVIPTGEKHITRMILPLGFGEIECNDEHKFLTHRFRDKRHTYPLKKGEFKFLPVKEFDDCTALVLAKLPEIPGSDVEINWEFDYGNKNPNIGQYQPVIPTIPKIWNEDLAWLIGFFIGDGSYHTDGVLRFSMNEVGLPLLQKSLEDTVRRLFNIEVCGNRANGFLSICNKQVWHFFKYLIGDIKHRVPLDVFKCSSPVRWAFVSGLFDSDGCIRENHSLCISTSYETLRDDLKYLWNSLGVYVATTELDKSLEQSHYLVNYHLRPITVSMKDTVRNIKSRHDSKVVRVEQARHHKYQYYGVGEKDGYYLIHPGEIVDSYESHQCFNLTVEDVHEYEVGQLVSKNSGGGTGFSFSRLRAKNSAVKSTQGVASGPVSFARVFDAATETIKQGGKRRGANMGVLRVDHPDIMEFIRAKTTEGVLKNFNLSVALTDKFMQAYYAADKFDLVNPHDGKVVERIDAIDLFDQIIKLAWNNGEPGILFIDEANRDNPVPQLGDAEATNPCGEQWLLPYESCNLGSINLGNFVDRKVRAVNWVKLEQVTRIAVRFLDNVIECNKFPIPQIEEMTLKTRKIGLGIMGLHDYLIQLGLPYNSQEGRDAAAKVMAFIHEIATNQSQLLAMEKGPFPAYDPKINKYIPRRNAALTSIQPTGTVSMLADCVPSDTPIRLRIRKKTI